MTLFDAARLRQQAELEQAMASMTQTATILFGYHRALLAAGFTEGQALNLTTAFQQQIMTQSYKQVEGGSQ